MMSETAMLIFYCLIGAIVIMGATGLSLWNWNRESRESKKRMRRRLSELGND